MRVITFSRFFPVKHPRAGEQTYFVEKVFNSLDIFGEYNVYINYPKQWRDGSWRIPITWRGEDHGKKFHTIRAGNRWKVGEQFSPRVWSGKPYWSKQVQFAPPITIEKIWDITIEPDSYAEGLDVLINDKVLVDAVEVNRLALNDGLDMSDFFDWFNVHPKKKKQVFTGQILCWNENINY